MVILFTDDKAILEQFDFGAVAECEVFVEKNHEYTCPKILYLS